MAGPTESPAEPAKPEAAARKKSLAQLVVDVLGAAGKEMTIPEITEAVLKTGYRSKSKDLGAVIGQRLSELKEVTRVRRGVYRLRK